MSGNLKNLLETGQAVDIKYELKDGDILTLKSSISGVPDEEHIIITAPIHEAKLFSIHEDKTIYIYVNKVNAGTHKFRAKVVERFKRDNVNLLLVRKTGKLTYAQRRDFYRHSILMTVKLEIFSPEGVVADSFNTMTKDISGGGIRLITKKKIKKGTLVRCNIPIEEFIISPIGEVVRTQLMPDSVLLHDVAISFTDVLERDRSKIISYIFKCQQKTR